MSISKISAHLALVGLLAIASLTMLPGSANADPMEETVVLLVELGKELTRAGSDCDKVASAIEGWATRNGERLAVLEKELDELMSKGDMATIEAMEKKFEGRMEAAFGKLGTALETCATHAGTLTALEKLGSMTAGGGNEASAKSADEEKALQEAMAAAKAAENAGQDNVWGPNCLAYFKEVEVFCKANQATMKDACVAWMDSIMMMKDAAGMSPEVAAAAEDGCKTGLDGIKQAAAAMPK